MNQKGNYEVFVCVYESEGTCICEGNEGNQKGNNNVLVWLSV